MPEGTPWTGQKFHKLKREARKKTTEWRDSQHQYMARMAAETATVMHTRDTVPPDVVSAVGDLVANIRVCPLHVTHSTVRRILNMMV